MSDSEHFGVLTGSPSTAALQPTSASSSSSCHSLPSPLQPIFSSSLANVVEASAPMQLLVHQFPPQSQSYSSTSTLSSLPCAVAKTKTQSASISPSRTPGSLPISNLESSEGCSLVHLTPIPFAPISTESQDLDMQSLLPYRDAKADGESGAEPASMVRLRLSVLEPVNPHSASRPCSESEIDVFARQFKSRVTIDAGSTSASKPVRQRARPRAFRKTGKTRRRNTIDIQAKESEFPVNSQQPLRPPPTPLVAVTKAAKARVSLALFRERGPKSLEAVQPKKLPPPHVVPGPPADPRASIADVLRPSTVYENTVLGDCWPMARRLLNRIFGVPKGSRLDSFVQIEPKATRVFTVLILSFFNAPKGDIGIGIGPKLRALITFAASSACGCTYWLGHAAMMHSLFSHQPSVPPSKFSVLATLKAKNPAFPAGETTHSGENHSQPRVRQSQQQGAPRFSLDRGREHVIRALRMRGATDTAGCSPAELAAIRLASGMSTIPHAVSTDLVDDVLMHYGEKRTEQIMLLVSAMGFLNRWVDLVDVGIEWDCYKYHEANATEIGAIAWGKHFKVNELEEERSHGHSTHGGNSGSSSRRYMSSLGRPFETLKLLLPSSRLDREWLCSIPNSTFSQREYMHDRIGFYPYYLDAIRHDKRALRGLLYVMDHMLFTSSDDLPKHTRALLCLVLARFAQCDTLTAQFAYIAHRFGATAPQIQYCSDWGYLSACSKELVVSSSSIEKCIFSPLQVSALLLAHCSKGTPSRVRVREVCLMQEFMSHSTIAEAITVISLFMVLQRWTSVNRATRLEAVVKQFAESPLGRRLGIPCEVRK